MVLEIVLNRDHLQLLHELTPALYAILLNVAVVAHENASPME